MDDEAQHPKADMREFVLEFYRNRFGLAKIAHTRLAKFLVSSLKHDERAMKLNSAMVGRKVKGVVLGSNEQCKCGNRFLTDSIFCRKCGTHRPGAPVVDQPPMVCEATHEHCGCGNKFRGDSKFCRKCGRERPKVAPTGEQCGCGNIFLTDSKYCRRCGEKRPGNTDPRPERKGESSHMHCACGNAFAGDSLYCRKCGVVRPDELPNMRFGMFLEAVGLKAQRLTAEDSECGGLLMLMLRRGFSKNIKAMGELLSDEARRYKVPIELGVHMVIGLNAERASPETWDTPQLSTVCSQTDIEELLQHISNLQTQRHGSPVNDSSSPFQTQKKNIRHFDTLPPLPSYVLCPPSQKVIAVDDVLHEGMRCYLDHKKKQQDALVQQEAMNLKAKEKEMAGRTGNLDDTFDYNEDDYISIAGLISESDTIISRMNQVHDSEAKVLVINALRERLGESMGAYFDSTQACLMRRSVQQCVEARSAAQRERTEATRQFRAIDEDGDGTLTLEELEKGAKMLGLTVEEARKFFVRLDQDNSGGVDIDEFLEAFHAIVRVTNYNRTEEEEGKLENPVLPIDTRPVGSPRVYSVDPKKMEMQRALEAHEDKQRMLSTDKHAFSARKTSLFGWPMEKQEVGGDDADAAKGAMTILDSSTFEVLGTTRWADGADDDEESVASALPDLLKNGTAKDFHSSLLYQAFKEMNLRQRRLNEGPHRMACAAYLDECAIQEIFPKPILDYFTPRPDYHDDDNSCDTCVCGHIYAYFACYCKRCGSLRENHRFKQPVIIHDHSTFAMCECGYKHGGDARFCIKCGHKRPAAKGSHLRCDCLNYFLSDSKYCRRCGAKRPPPPFDFNSVNGNSAGEGDEDIFKSIKSI